MNRSISHFSFALSLFIVGSFATRTVAGAQEQKQAAVKITEEKRGLFSRAKVSGDSAQKVALARVTNGRITKGELEEEDGKLIYSFDIKVAGKRGIEEVHVDALTGAVIKTEHEGETEVAPKKKPVAKPKPNGTGDRQRS